MVAPRRKNLIAHRRRTDDDGEEEGSIVAGVEDDSLSENSVPSDVDDDADADGEGSDASEPDTPRKMSLKRRNGEKHSEANGNIPNPAPGSKMPSFTENMEDTEAMMNGMKISGNADAAEEIHFDDAGVQSDGLENSAAVLENPTTLRGGSFAERRRREHEEYKKKRDEDPAFVPNRGGFFMHDHRVNTNGQNGFRPAGRGGRGRGRGPGGPFSPVNAHPTSNPADAPWAHDLHQTVADPMPSIDNAKGFVASGPAKLPLPTHQTPSPNRLFSRTTQVGNVQIRVFLSGMKDPITFTGVPVNQHTRLPQHRPPLRRDKPVRISLPNCPPRYIFPAVDRSFIFIPRALRPNQQGFGRGRGRGSYGGYGGFPSARNSTYGGSTYSPSVAMSRRSSLAREIGRDGMISPAGSVMSRNQSNIMQGGKPVVRLPPSASPSTFQQAPPVLPYYPPYVAPIVNLPQAHAYPLPQKPINRENWTGTLPMHQPRPQKAVSVAGIESPAGLHFHPPQQQQQQPFHHQVPLPSNGQVYPPDQNVYPHSRRPSHPSQRGTPLSQIPERAIHAQPFQPFPYQQQPQAYYPQQYPTPVYYYPSPATAMGSASVAAPPFVPGQQYSYVVSTAPPVVAPEAIMQPGTVAHESNGMVYYYDSSQLTAPAEDPTTYQHMAFAPPPTGYIMPQPTVFYPPPQ